MSRLSAGKLPPGKPVRKHPDEWCCEACPFCGKRWHFYWNKVKLKGYCQACTRKVIGQWQLERAYAGGLVDDQGFDFPTAPPQPLEAFLKPSGWEPGWGSPESRQMLLGRGLNEDDAVAARISWVEEEGSLTVPIEGWSTESPPALLYRRIRREGAKWIPLAGTSLLQYGYGLSQHQGDRVVLVEGVFDVLSPKLLGNAVALLGTRIEDNRLTWLKTQGIRWAVLWLDPDDAGRRCAIAAADHLPAWGIGCCVVGPWPRWTFPRGTEVIEFSEEPGDCAPHHPIIKTVRQLCVSES